MLNSELRHAESRVTLMTQKGMLNFLPPAHSLRDKYLSKSCHIWNGDRTRSVVGPTPLQRVLLVQVALILLNFFTINFYITPLPF